METYVMKIRDEFIASINSGIKKREYRLCDEWRSQIKPGDVLVLTSNTVEGHFVRARVTGITRFANWEAALKAHWEEDFSSIYTTFENAVEACRHFYETNQVERFGIVVFNIEALKAPLLRGASILLDRDTFIQKESFNMPSDETTKFFNWLEKMGSNKYLHPNIKKEIDRYVNESLKERLLADLKGYKLLTPNSGQSHFFENVVKTYPQNEYGNVDNELLAEVYYDHANFLITNDKETLQKAKDLYLRERVLSQNEYLDMVERLFPELVSYKILKIKQEHFTSFDLNAPFFDSLRKDYNFSEKKEFDQWFHKKVINDESAYVFRDGKDIKGFLYLKLEEAGTENYADIKPSFPPKRRLKIGTFKNEHNGLRFGERFLKIVFDNAVRWGVEEIYVTFFEDRRDEVKGLKKLFTSWGFICWGKKGEETVLVKSMKKYDETKDAKFNYPLTKPAPRYFFLPIEPEYHTDLFPDYILTNEDVTFYSEEEMAHRYALEKVYVSSKDANYIEAKPGDILVIYRIGDRRPKKYFSVVTGTAILDKVITPPNLDDFKKECKNVSVFSGEQLTDFYLHRNFHTIIKLIQLDSFKKKVTSNFLQDKGIIEKDGGARPFQSMSSEQYRIIINEASGAVKKGD